MVNAFLVGYFTFLLTFPFLFCKGFREGSEWSEKMCEMGTDLKMAVQEKFHGFRDLT